MISDMTQYSAIDLLGQIGNNKHVELLAPQLDNADWAVRRSTISAIVQLGDARHATLVYDQLLKPRFVVNSPLAKLEKEAILTAFKAIGAKPEPEGDAAPMKQGLKPHPPEKK